MNNNYSLLRDRARQLRSEPTPAERRTWEALRNRRCGGLRFNRQTVMGQYIADFYCPEVRLVLEIDGGIHDVAEQRERDRWRDIALRERGLWVLRLRNAFVLRATSEQLCHVLLEAIAQQPSR